MMARSGQFSDPSLSRGCNASLHVCHGQILVNPCGCHTTLNICLSLTLNPHSRTALPPTKLSSTHSERCGKMQEVNKRLKEEVGSCLLSELVPIAHVHAYLRSFPKGSGGQNFGWRRKHFCGFKKICLLPVAQTFGMRVIPEEAGSVAWGQVS